MSNEQKLPPVPKATLADGMHAGTRALLGMIPVAGSAVAEFVNYVIVPPLESRRTKWLELLAAAIEELYRTRGVTVEQLRDNLIFIDADKPSTADYFLCALKLSRRGSLIIVDNVIRKGALLDAASADPNVLGMRRFIELAAAQPGVTCTALQTVGSKGYDGFALVLVTGDTSSSHPIDSLLREPVETQRSA